MLPGQRRQLIDTASLRLPCCVSHSMAEPQKWQSSNIEANIFTPAPYWGVQILDTSIEYSANYCGIRRVRVTRTRTAQNRTLGQEPPMNAVFQRSAGAAFLCAVTVAGLGTAPTAGAYDSWCDLVESHGARIALLAEPLRTNPGPMDIGRLNSYYNRVIPLLNTVGFATFWYPNVWGSPDIRSDTRDLLAGMHTLQDSANYGQPTADMVQDVDNAVAVLHSKCDGRVGLPPRGTTAW
ncbi:hypothetical protein GCM10009856_51810 [Mycolicibacterium llatzerense]